MAVPSSEVFGPFLFIKHLTKGFDYRPLHVENFSKYFNENKISSLAYFLIMKKMKMIMKKKKKMMKMIMMMMMAVI